MLLMKPVLSTGWCYIVHYGLINCCHQYHRREMLKEKKKKKSQEKYHTEVPRSIWQVNKEKEWSKTVCRSACKHLVPSRWCCLGRLRKCGLPRQSIPLWVGFKRLKTLGTSSSLTLLPRDLGSQLLQGPHLPGAILPHCDGDRLLIPLEL